MSLVNTSNPSIVSGFDDTLEQNVRSSACLLFPDHSEQIGKLDFAIERPNDRTHGDFSTNIAMVGARVFRQAPKTTADALAELLVQDPLFESVTVAGAGFINFIMSAKGWLLCLQKLVNKHEKKHVFETAKTTVLVEFVSANPTGPLHVGHGRGAAVGDSLVRLLRRTGHTVTAEYYVNDAGLQITNLGKSVLARVEEQQGKDVVFPENGYQGAYIEDMAADWQNLSMPQTISDDEVGRWAGEKIRLGIQDDLQSFGVKIDSWFSELTLHTTGMIESAISKLRQHNYLYEEEGALWFASTRFGDVKDRVVVRANGIYTYFAADIAYHLQKLERGFDRLVDIWGADHHGYIPRVQGAMQALRDIERTPEKALEVILIQFVALVRDGAPVQMSTRAGNYETLSDLVNMVGKDATRFFYLLRRPDSHLEFDLGLAQSQSNENPVYYVQYAHARCASLQQKINTNISLDDSLQEYTSTKMAPQEKELLLLLDSWGEVLQTSAQAMAPHQIVFYLQELAGVFHRFYGACPVATAEKHQQQGRLLLAKITQSILADGLNIVGVSAPDRM